MGSSKFHGPGVNGLNIRAPLIKRITKVSKKRTKSPLGLNGHPSSIYHIHKLVEMFLIHLNKSESK